MREILILTKRGVQPFPQNIAHTIGLIQLAHLMLQINGLTHSDTRGCIWCIKAYIAKVL
jgi:hypothetical protein